MDEAAILATTPLKWASGSPNSYEYKSDERCGISRHRMNELDIFAICWVEWKTEEQKSSLICVAVRALEVTFLCILFTYSWFTGFLWGFLRGFFKTF